MKEQEAVDCRKHLSQNHRQENPKRRFQRSKSPPARFLGGAGYSWCPVPNKKFSVMLIKVGSGLHCLLLSSRISIEFKSGLYLSFAAAY
jgi:hypothetical protein